MVLAKLLFLQTKSQKDIHTLERLKNKQTSILKASSTLQYVL